MERCTGLNISGFVPMKILLEHFHSPLASGVYYLTIAKCSQENFCGTLETTKV